MLHIINTGVANIRSLTAAFDRLQQPWQLTEDAQAISETEHCVLPGVGAFAAAAAALDRMQIRSAIIDRINADRPLLCICLGMQLLAQSSEEANEVEAARGLGIIPHRIERFSNAVKIPQLGWNRVQPKSSDTAGPFPAGEAYFANSFRLANEPDGWGVAITNYGEPFVSSLWRGRVLACQFHPELSGAWGQQVLKTWLER